jgi:ubiquinone/menaquinone biosynthesis C-methylase UbiE
VKGFDARQTYDAASHDYEDASSQFWQYLSRRTVDRLGLERGERVLDIACGTGPGVVEAARLVGENGLVVGVDYAEQMLALAREKVDGLPQVDLRAADVTQLDPPEAPFDAVLSVLGIFFFDDMPGFVRALWSWTRPGGRLAVTVLGLKFYDPMRDAFLEAVREVRPDVEVIEPWRRTEDPATFAAVFESAGVPVDIETEDEPLPFGGGNDWWRIVMGSGLRRTAVALGDDAAEVRARCDRFVEDNGVDEVVLQAHYALAQRPG